MDYIWEGKNHTKGLFLRKHANDFALAFKNEPIDDPKFDDALNSIAFELSDFEVFWVWTKLTAELRSSNTEKTFFDKIKLLHISALEKISRCYSKDFFHNYSEEELDSIKLTLPEIQ